MSSLDSESATTSATVHQWRHLANRHQVGWGETLLIALNIHGLRSHGDGPGTIRLKVRPPEAEVFQVVIPTGRETSPFTIAETELCVDGTPVAEVVDARVDHAVGGYLRAGGRAATIHPYAGSADAGTADTREGYSRLLADLAISLPAGMTLADIDEVTVSASAYPSEAQAIDDLADLRSAMAGLDMSARIGLLSSAVRSEAGMRRLAEEVAPFALFLDADYPGTGQEAPLPEVLANARSCGHDTSFTYTVGNDPLDVMREQLLPLAQYTTVWPSLFILQTPSSEEDAAHIAEPEQRLEFFLQARTMLERIFAPTSLQPQPWRCYRGLWYREYSGEPLPGPWI